MTKAEVKLAVAEVLEEYFKARITDEHLVMPNPNLAIATELRFKYQEQVKEAAWARLGKESP
jgi:hypothetical protein